jgi:hypothetical protein
VALELDILDQLLGGDMSLAEIHRLYTDDKAFAHSIHSLLACGDIRLLAEDGSEVPRWRWRELFVEGDVLKSLSHFMLTLTDQGTRRVA